MSWLAVRVRPGGDRQAVLDALFRAGSGGVQEEGDALLTHFPGDADGDRIRGLVEDASPSAAIEISPAPEIDWSEAWKEKLRRHEVGRLTVAPPWLVDESDGERTIVIEPAMAFGTGDHATTRGALRLLQQAVRPGDRVADLGAGSAILAIAAARLGAEWVAGIENDPMALGNAEENVQRNGVGDRVRIIGGDAELLLQLVAPVRLITANIISSVLTRLLPIMSQALTEDGEAVLAGILVGERAGMIDVIEGDGFLVREELPEEEWWSALIARR